MHGFSHRRQHAHMNGAQSLIRTLLASDVDVCFANPGTSEMHFVVALDQVQEMRAVLGLFEGGVTGMADGYGRMAGKPAASLLHLGSGLGNGIANLHNARRAQTPLVNIVGDHATYHKQWDTPLVSDIEGLARPVSCWVRTSQSAHTVASDAALAVAAARAAPGGVATLILPADTAWNEAGGPADPLPVAGPAAPRAQAVAEAVRLLRSGEKSVIITRGAALHGEGLNHLARIAAASGAGLMCDTQTPRITRGAGYINIERVPYRVEAAVARFADVKHLILVGTHPPVAAFAYPNYPSWCLPEGINIHYLSHDHEDGTAALREVAAALPGGNPASLLAEHELPALPNGKLDQFSIGAVLARLMPEGAVVVDESATSGLGPAMATITANPHDWLSNTGGAIGQGIPVATGAAIGAPGRRVINLQADGSAAYTLQALWTQAREQLDVVTVIFSNGRYSILDIELERVGATAAGPMARGMFDLGRPNIDWTQLAAGFGVEASRATTIEQFADQLASALKAKGPRLIEAII